MKLAHTRTQQQEKTIRKLTIENRIYMEYMHSISLDSFILWPRSYRTTAPYVQNLDEPQLPPYASTPERGGNDIIHISFYWHMFTVYCLLRSITSSRKGAHQHILLPHKIATLRAIKMAISFHCHRSWFDLCSNFAQAHTHQWLGYYITIDTHLYITQYTLSMIFSFSFITLPFVIIIALDT